METKHPKRLMIADDHAVFRHGLRSILSDAFEIVAEASEGGQAVDLAVQHRPDVIVLDIHLPGMDGIEAARQIRGATPETTVIIISADDREEQVLDAIAAGASAFLAKDEDIETMVSAIACAVDGQASLPPRAMRQVMTAMASGATAGGAPRASARNLLSDRQVAVLKLMAEGSRTKDIAAALCISERTVANHIASIYNKLGIDDRTQAVVYAIKNGIVRI